MLSLLTVLLLAASPTPSPVESQCVSAQGRTACGYACRATGTQARCAQTPAGMCTVLQGEVYCFDPPRAVIHHPPGASTTPSCRQSGNAVACGYGCSVSEGRVACARTPYGVCSLLNGQQVCWDPSEQTIHQYGATLPTPQCRAAGSTVACGYACQATLGQVACARTPAGRCTAQGGQVSCWDPPALHHCSHGG
ncbi:hypothetical protein P2318_33250 [Myxococcaceae bacterium GXIMD 01537]